MKLLQLTFLTCFICMIARAQKDFTNSLEGIEWVKIESKAEIVVKTHTSNQLLIKLVYASKVPERAKGLKLVGDGTDNTDIGFYVFKEGSNLIVRNLRKGDKGKAEIFLPASQNISVKTDGTGQCDIEITGFVGEIEASAELNGSITIKDVTGPITANSLNGEVDVLFTKVSQDSPITISTINGELDVTLPKNTPADLSLKVTNGEIYSNFELSVPSKNGLKAISTQRIKGSINSGGVKIQLSSVNGNIYLRKQ